MKEDEIKGLLRSGAGGTSDKGHLSTYVGSDVLKSHVAAKTSPFDLAIDVEEEEKDENEEPSSQSLLLQECEISEIGNNADILRKLREKRSGAD